MSIRISPNIANSVPFRQQPNLVNTQKTNEPLASASVAECEKYRLKADEAQKQGYFDKAINLYKQALMYNPDDYDTNLNLAKTYKLNGDDKNAIPYFEKVEKANPADLENITILGECYKNIGQYKNAERHFLKVLKQDPNYDYANRNLLDTQNLMLACYNPSLAYKERQAAATQNLNTAISMATSFLPKNVVKNIQDVTITFAKTAKMGGRSNIAQYEHNSPDGRKISVMDDYTYANPVIVATYLTHEGIHAADKDPYTSIREEQDAYRVQAEFWVKNAKNIEDPEMNYVADLYKQSVKSLDNRVAEIYKLRDPNIAEVSPNHPPGTKMAAAAAMNSNQPLKAYDIIV